MPITLSNTRLKVAMLAILAGFASCENTANEKKEADAVAEANPVTAATGLRDLHWLAGNWQIVSEKGIIFENWTLNENGSLAGVSGFIKGADTEVSETISIEEREQNICYIPTVKGQNNDQPVPFTLTSAAGDSFVFENPGHDFPDKIIYYNKSATELTAWIRGKINGKDASRSFQFSKQ